MLELHSLNLQASPQSLLLPEMNRFLSEYERGIFLIDVLNDGNDFRKVLVNLFDDFAFLRKLFGDRDDDDLNLVGSKADAGYDGFDNAAFFLRIISRSELLQNGEHGPSDLVRRLMLNHTVFNINQVMAVCCIETGNQLLFVVRSDLELVFVSIIPWVFHTNRRADVHIARIEAAVAL